MRSEADFSAASAGEQSGRGGHTHLMRVSHVKKDRVLDRQRMNDYYRVSMI